METLRWEVLEHHLRESNPSALDMGGSRGARIGFNPAAGQLFLSLPVDGDSVVSPSPYEALSVRIAEDETGRVLEIATRAHHLYRDFHKLCTIVTEHFEAPDQTAIGAFDTAMECWRELIERKSLLTDNQQLGLQAELIVLRALLTKTEPESISAWTGRTPARPERHDFRLATVDLEVKATRGGGRFHTIHGLRQLQPSQGHRLFLLSIRLESGGAANGSTLPDEVQAIRKHLAGQEARDFEAKLASSGYLDADSGFYQTHLKLADEPTLVPVDASCPKLTREMLESVLPLEVGTRIDDVSYVINVEGLGFAQGSSDFQAVLGNCRMESQ